MKLAHEFTFKIEIPIPGQDLSLVIRPWVGKLENAPISDILSAMTKARDESKKWLQEVSNQEGFKMMEKDMTIACRYCSELGQRIIALENFDACETTATFYLSADLDDDFMIASPGICLYKNWPN